MSELQLITPPDKLFNHNKKFLLIYPSNDIKEQFNYLTLNYDEPVDVYIYEQDKLEHDIDWLLSVCKLADYVILDIDNCPPEIRELASYIIANNNTFWLTNSNDSYYNKLSVNRIYNLDFLQTKERGINERSQ
jgi:hypothetical protein